MLLDNLPDNFDLKDRVDGLILNGLKFIKRPSNFDIGQMLIHLYLKSNLTTQILT